MLFEIKDLSKSFKDKIIFTSFSCKFKDKGTLAIVGDSGIGKTTLLRIIAGLDTDYSGELIFPEKCKVSFAFQEHRLFPTVSALDNLVLVSFGKKTKEAVVASSKMLKALGFAEDDMKLRPSELSGGMKQRVSLARAFLRDSEILLLDEPTKELDSDNISLVIEEIKRQSVKRLVIIVTHRKEDIEALNAEILTLSHEDEKAL